MPAVAVEPSWMPRRRKVLQVGPSSTQITDPRFHLTGKQVTSPKIINEALARAIAVVLIDYSLRLVCCCFQNGRFLLYIQWQSKFQIIENKYYTCIRYRGFFPHIFSLFFPISNLLLERCSLSFVTGAKVVKKSTCRC